MASDQNDERIPEWVYAQSKGRKGTIIVSKLAENIRKWRLAKRQQDQDAKKTEHQEDPCRSIK